MHSSEYSAFWRCVKAGAAYLVTQTVKVYHGCGINYDVSLPRPYCKVNQGNFVRGAIPYPRIPHSTMRAFTKQADGIPSSYW